MGQGTRPSRTEREPVTFMRIHGTLKWNVKWSVYAPFAGLVTVGQSSALTTSLVKDKNVPDWNAPLIWRSNNTPLLEMKWNVWFYAIFSAQPSAHWLSRTKEHAGNKIRLLDILNSSSRPQTPDWENPLKNEMPMKRLNWYFKLNIIASLNPSMHSGWYEKCLFVCFWL